MEKRAKNKRVTIHDIARSIGVAPSTVSKALNDLPSASAKIKALVDAKARELNYKHNSNAANLRRGSSRTVGVIVPRVNVALFSDAISGIEECCFENDHRLIICQSDESYEKEVKAVDTLLKQNVDCILISLSRETKSTHHLREITNHYVHLVQFDRVDPSFQSHMVVNDNIRASYNAVKHLVEQGYRRIALLGGPEYLPVYKERKDGYLQAIKETELEIPYYYLTDNAVKTDLAMSRVTELLKAKNRPDAFFAVSDYAALGALKAARSLGLNIPDDVGIVGFSNEIFTEVTTPALSSVMQWGKEIGIAAVDIYFSHILRSKSPAKKQDFITRTIDSTLIIRESSTRIPTHNKSPENFSVASP